MHITQFITVFDKEDITPVRYILSNTLFAKLQCGQSKHMYKHLNKTKSVHVFIHCKCT